MFFSFHFDFIDVVLLMHKAWLNSVGIFCVLTDKHRINLFKVNKL